MVDKKSYYNEIDKIFAGKKIFTEGIKAEFDIIYQAYAARNVTTEAKLAVRKTLDFLFGNNYNADYSVPDSFYDTTLGQCIGYIRFGRETIYDVADLIELTGFSRAYLNKEAHSQNIKGFLKNATWVFYESEVLKYLNKKEIPFSTFIEYIGKKAEQEKQQ